MLSPAQVAARTRRPGTSSSVGSAGTKRNLDSGESENYNVVATSLRGGCAGKGATSSDDGMAERLGEFGQILLFALLRLEGEAHGVAIREEIERRTGRAPSPGAIYTALSRLEAAGLVTSHAGDSTPARGGRRRKYWVIQPEGAVALRESYLALSEMAEGVLSRMAELAMRAGSGMDQA